MATILNSLSLLGSALDDLGIRYAVVGSVAHATQGVDSAPRDLDLLADIEVRQAQQLAGALGPDWHCEAFTGPRPFSVINVQSLLKVDIFPATNEFHRGQLDRATRLSLPGGLRFPVVAAEDLVTPTGERLP